jgi:hypothetical protein
MKDPGKPGLPPGGGTRLTIVVTLVLGAVAMAIYAFVKRGDAVSHGAKVGVTIVGLVLPLLALAGAYAVFRTLFPPKAKHLHLSVTNPEVQRGAEVVVSLEITRPEKVGDKLELGLVCTEYYDVQTTDGRGNKTRSTRPVPAYEDWRPQKELASNQATVRFPVPADAPFSYRGHCLSYVWRVSAREPLRGRFDRAVNLPLVVRP